MREILFRGKRIDNGEWVEGSLLYDADLEQYQICGFNYFNGENGLEREPFSYIVIPETVGQCIELNNERHRIFLGDIVSWNNIIGVVKYGDFNPRYYAKDIYHSYKIKGVFVETVDGKQLVLPTKSRAKIIGNIHDNPELLEVK